MDRFAVCEIKAAWLHIYLPRARPSEARVVGSEVVVPVPIFIEITATKHW